MGGGQRLSQFADRLRSILVFGGDLPTFDVSWVPAEPTGLFATWLTEAVAAGVPEPHASILSTVDADGHPDARVLILKDVTTEGWWFASSANSPKGMQLAACPFAAMTWYWPGQGRQIRVRGEVHPASAEDSAADYLARAPGGRAEALVGRQSEPLRDHAQLAEALAAAESELNRHPDLVAKDWTRYVLSPTEVQFFQGDANRHHVRVRYTRTGDNWTHTLLWP
ncbi:MAG TPA: pyridoxal 5'-phosphate synthase [Pseudonocardiaceae bacterium]|nr:pyridoxal 5'-phosphate synthase [Pseudonocardiaceae bacterium]